MDITFDIEKYLAKVDFTETELDFLCVKKAEVIGVQSRQSVKILCEGTEYSDVPVWIHTDCGARHWYMKGIEAIESNQEPPIAPSAEEYFKDAALMFPFTNDQYINIDENNEFLPLAPKVLAVFMVTEEATTALGVINILENIKDNPDRESYKTYRPFLKFRIRHIIGISHVEWSRTYLYDILEDRIAKSPTWSYQLDKWVAPIIELKDIEDADVDEELQLFLGDSFFLSEARMRMVPEEIWSDGTVGYAEIAPNFGISTNIHANFLNGTVSYCDGETYRPGWTATYTGDIDAGAGSLDAECICGFGTYVAVVPPKADRSFQFHVTSQLPRAHFFSPPLFSGNVSRYGTIAVARYMEVDIETPDGITFHQSPENPVLWWFTGDVKKSYSERLLLTDLTNEEEGYQSEEIKIHRYKHEFSAVVTFLGGGYGTPYEHDWNPRKWHAGKLYYELSARFRGNFFISCDSFNFLQVASYEREGIGFAGYYPLPTMGYSVISDGPDDVFAYCLQAYTGKGFIETENPMNFITNTIAAYHHGLVESGFYSSIEQASIDYLGIWGAYYYFFPLEYEKAKIIVELQGLHFVPFNREIALVIEAEEQ
jgi:hypothetical protein